MFQPTRAFINIWHTFMYLIKALDGQNIVQLVRVPKITTVTKKYNQNYKIKQEYIKNNTKKLLCTIPRVHKRSGHCGFIFI